MQAQNISLLRSILSENQTKFLEPGRLSDREMDEIEEQILTYVSTCKDNIDKLQHFCQDETSPEMNASEKAHRQGCILILAERLKGATSSFESLRNIRQTKIEIQELSKKRRTPKMAKTQQQASSLGTSLLTSFSSQLGTQPAAHAGQAGTMQTQMQSENIALQMELMNLSDQVQQAERTVREIASLNQAFSAAIFHQAEQIEHLYQEAVQATEHISMGNVQLEKTIRVNKGSRKYLLIMLLFFSIGLLFLDWWYS